MRVLTEAAIYEKEANLNLLEETIAEQKKEEVQARKDQRAINEKVRELENTILQLKQEAEEAHIKFTHLGFDSKNKEHQASEGKKEIEMAWEDFHVQKEIETKKTFLEQLELVLNEKKNEQNDVFQDFARVRNVAEVMKELTTLLEGNRFTNGALALRSSKKQFEESLEKLCRKKIKKLPLYTDDIEQHKNIFGFLLNHAEIQAIWMVANEQSEECVNG